MTPLADLTDQELINQAKQLLKLADQDAATDPAALLHHLLPNYTRRPHTDIIGRALADMRTTYDHERHVAGPRILIEEPPQTGKTLTGVVGAAFWWLIHHPTHRVVIGSYGDALAIERGAEIRRLVTEYGERYGLTLARGSSSKQDWRLTTGGGVLSVGVGSGVTGRSADIAFVDDPHKSRAEADSLLSRDTVERWMSADMLSRLSPGAPLILIMTPWHPDDIASRLVSAQGRVETGGRWQVIRMPALCDDPDNDPLGRAYGAPLPHPKISVGAVDQLLEHWQERRRASTVQDWSALYMCNPQPTEGALVSLRTLRERRAYETGSPSYPVEQKRIRTAVAVDPSGGGRDTAGIVGGYLGADKRLYLTHDVSGVMSSDQWARRACQLAVEIDADRIVVEKNFGGDMATLIVRTAWTSMIQDAETSYRHDIEQVVADNTLDLTTRQRKLAKLDREFTRYQRLCPRIVSVSARTNKRLRADPIAQQWIEDRVRTAAYLPEVEQEWATWQADLKESPGRIDASVYLAYELLPVPGASKNGTIRRSVGASLPVSGMGSLGSGGGVSSLGPLG